MAGVRRLTARVRRACRGRADGLFAAALVVVIGAAAVLAGAGATGAVPRFQQATAWLVNAVEGSVTQANGLSGRADARITLSGAQGHRLRVIQDGPVVLVQDQTTGLVSRIDPARLAVSGSAGFGGAGLHVVADAHVAYVIDPTRHLVQRIDPVTLAVIGGALDVGAAPGTGVLDSHDVLWLPVADRGELLPIRAAAADGGPVAGTPLAVAPAHDALTVALAGDTPVVVDSSAGKVVVAAQSGARLSVELPAGFSGPASASLLVPESTDGTLVPILAPRAGQLTVVDTASGVPSVVNLGVAAGEQLGTPAVLGDRVYVPDETSGSLLVYDSASGRLLPQVKVGGVAGALEVFVKDGLLWADSDGTSDAVAIDGSGVVRQIGKYDPALPGGPTEPSPSPDSSTSTAGPAGPAGPPGPAGPGSSPPLNSAPGQPSSYSRPSVPASSFAFAPPSRIPSSSQSSVPRPSTISSSSSSSSPSPSGTTPSPTPSSSPSTAPAQPPQPPTGPSATAGPGYITVRFTPSAGATPTGYTLGGVPAGATVSPASIPADGSQPYTFKVSGLSCAQTYPFTVQAAYAGGRVPSASTAAVRPCVVPSAPASVSANASVEHTVAVTWTPPASNGGATVTYDLAWSGGGSSGGKQDLGATNYTFTAANQQTYTVTVAAKNSAGSSTPPAKTTAKLFGPQRGYNIYNNSSLQVNMRSGPHTTSQIMTSFPPTPSGGRGAAVTVLCQIQGDQFADPVVPSVNGDIWDYVSVGGKTGYISDLYVSTPDSVAGNYHSYSDPPLWNCQ